ncbi:MAG: histone deacetylase [Acidimicrobiales bacterium]|nr:histone deacetylase [Acidimicrobiales bacterium]
MTILVASHPQFLLHDTGHGHPERPARLTAVMAGLDAAGLREEMVVFEPEPAPWEAVERVHPGRYLLALEELAAVGGGHLDADTVVSEDSFAALLRAAGAGLDAVARLDAGEGDAAFCAVRPPGHHATPRKAMGFCLANNVAVTAAALADRGERVLVVDYDAHHGNGTQDAFYGDPRVVYVSFHEYPLYPGTGAIDEVGWGEGSGSTVNFPLPQGATGDVFRAGLDEVVRPLVERWEPTWLIISAGFDAHRLDPLTGLALSAGDYADLTADLAGMVPGGRCIVYLEGGYDLDALAMSSGAALSALAGGSYRPEPATSGGPGRSVVAAVGRMRSAAGFD